jgi:hypothetical protein
MWIVLLAELLLGRSVAFADTGPSLRLALEQCRELDAGRVGRIVGSSLHARIVGSEEVSDSTTRAYIRCDEGAASLRVEDPITGKVSERELDLRAVDRRARERLLSLALSELIEASWLEVRIERARDSDEDAADLVVVDARAEPAVVETVRAALAQEPPRSFRVSLIGGLVLGLEPLRAAGGGGVRLDHLVDELWGWAAAISAAHA